MKTMKKVSMERKSFCSTVVEVAAANVIVVFLNKTCTNNM